MPRRPELDPFRARFSRRIIPPSPPDLSGVRSDIEAIETNIDTVEADIVSHDGRLDTLEALHSAIRVERSVSAQTFSSGVTTTVLFNSQTRLDDAAGVFSNSSGTITILTTGWYMVHASLVVGGAGAGNRLRVTITLDGVTQSVTDYPAGSATGAISVSDLLYIQANEIIRTGIFSDGTSPEVSASPASHMSVARVA